jgi:phosphoglycerate dehydrogenase-like enzyme
MAGRRESEEVVKVMIATPLEEGLVEEIREVDPRVDVLYEADLLPPPRYPSDHKGESDFRRSMEGEHRWEEMLGDAEVLFGAPGESTEGLVDAIRRGRNLRWIQATNAGVGEHVRAANLTREELSRVAITAATGVHATPLAEFSIFGLLAFMKDLPRLLRDKENKHWAHYPTNELRERTLLIVGLGKIGLEVARLARCFGMHIIGTKRRPNGELPNVGKAYSSDRLKELVPEADAVVVTVPLTEETAGIIDMETIELMKAECVLVNVGRGGVVDEQALIESLKENKIRGAALDVFQDEPLPEDSPLWTLSNVLISPHTAALSEAENQRIVELFTENLRRYLGGEPLLNRVDPEMFY